MLADMACALVLRVGAHLSSPPTLLTAHLYPLLKKSLKHPADKVRREVLRVLRGLVLAFPVMYRAMLLLVDPSNPEEDFLLNIADLSLPTRGKAIQKLFARITLRDPLRPDEHIANTEGVQVDTQVILQILLPLLHHFLYDTSGAMSNVSSGEEVAPVSRMKSASASSRGGSDHTLLETSLRLAGKLAAFLPFSAYYHALQGYLKLLRAKPALERVLVRLVCLFIREWHFECAETEAEVRARREEEARARKEQEKAARLAEVERRRQQRARELGVEAQYEEDQLMLDSSPAAAASAADDEPIPPPSELGAKVRSLLLSRLLPQLHGLLTGTKVKALRAKDKKDTSRGMATTVEEQNELTNLSGLAGGTKEVSSGGGGHTLELVRVPVAMALVALLRKLPLGLFHAEFPRLLTALALQLGQREQQARDLTRSTPLPRRPLPVQAGAQQLIAPARPAAAAAAAAAAVGIVGADFTSIAAAIAPPVAAISKP